MKKLQCFVPGMFSQRQETTQVEHVTVPPSKGRLLTVLTNMGMSETNALAYCSSFSDEGKKVFITLTPGVNVIKHFSFVTIVEAK